jgi:hypothetical protein
MEVCREALLHFGRQSDHDFTALAKGLSALNQRLSTLRTKAEQLDLLLQDKDGDQAVSSAYLLYKNALDLVHSSVGIAVSEQEQMNQIGQTLLRACRARETFQRNHLMLRILTMNMRMEAVRLDPEKQSIFSNIAAAIAAIDDKIVASTEGAFTRIEVVIAEASSTHEESKQLEQSLHLCAQTSVDRIQRELTSLKAALAPCARQSGEIAELIAQTAPRTLQAIGSLQHQDIVRQQLEHVSAGFTELGTHLQPDAAGHDHQLEPGYVYRATSVQRAHLGASRREIEKAAAEVSAGLRSLLELGEPLIKRFAALEDAAVRVFHECKVAHTFDQEIQQLVQIANKSAAANDKSSRLVERIEEVVRVFSQEIASHELDVKIVALNAQIASAQTLSADSLSRIAEETGTVADQNAILTGDLTRDLRTSLESLNGVKKTAAEFVALAGQEKNDLARSVGIVSEKLRRLGTRIQTDSAGARQDFQTAYDENRALLDGLNFDALIEQCYSPAEQLCKQLLEATASSAADDALSEKASTKLDTHRRRYTMRKENEIHATVLGVPTTSAVPANSRPEPFFAASVIRCADVQTAASTSTNTSVSGNPVELSSSATTAEPPDSTRKPGVAAISSPPKPDYGDGIELF